MSTQNIHFHVKIGKIPKISLDIYFLDLSQKFSRDPKRVQISHGKRVISV